MQNPQTIGAALLPKVCVIPLTVESLLQTKEDILLTGESLLPFGEGVLLKVKDIVPKVQCLIPLEEPVLLKWKERRKRDAYQKEC
ncbi:MAG TPA: hypothetical protein VFA15_09180, partial [Nitrososphaera sp.]|nr:hypothetical protein [Nitrososphaera sp.]